MPSKYSRFASVRLFVYWWLLMLACIVALFKHECKRLELTSAKASSARLNLPRRWQQLSSPRPWTVPRASDFGLFALVSLFLPSSTSLFHSLSWIRSQPTFYHWWFNDTWHSRSKWHAEGSKYVSTSYLNTLPITQVSVCRWDHRRRNPVSHHYTFFSRTREAAKAVESSFQ